jgi:hypothetical protein
MTAFAHFLRVDDEKSYNSFLKQFPVFMKILNNQILTWKI